MRKNRRNWNAAARFSRCLISFRVPALRSNNLRSLLRCGYFTCRFLQLTRGCFACRLPCIISNISSPAKIHLKKTKTRKFPLFFLPLYAKMIYSSLNWRNIGHVKPGTLFNIFRIPAKAQRLKFLDVKLKRKEKQDEKVMCCCVFNVFFE